MGKILFIPKKRNVIFPVKLGQLYNGFTLLDARGLTSSNNWDAPTQAQWEALATYLGGAAVAGGKLKEIGFTWFPEPNTGATNEVGFNARKTGVRTETGVFTQSPAYGHFWSKTFTTTQYRASVAYNFANLLGGAVNRKYGCAVRLLNTTTLLRHGETGIYTQNDGKVIRTICINGVEWLADCLCESRFRNGNIIPVVTTNAEWAALTTSGCCAYNNDYNNV